MIEGIIGTIIGTILGFILSEWSTKRKDDRAENKLAKSTRTMISLEIDQNLKMLHEVWSEINQTDDSQKDIENQKRVKARRLVKLPFWILSREVLDSQLSVLPVAFQDQEIVQIFQFYDCIQRLEGVRGNLVLSMQESKREFLEDTSPGPEGYRIAPLGFMPFQAFNRRVEELWDEYESIIAQIFAKGNPI